MVQKKKNASATVQPICGCQAKAQGKGDANASSFNQAKA
jgi:hypothetical protein